MVGKNLLSFVFGLLWANDPLRLKVAFISSFLFLYASKILSSLVPVVYKHLFESLSAFLLQQDLHALQNAIFLGVLLYAGMRFLAQILNELKEIIFVRVEQNAMRKLGVMSFSRLQSFGLSFHTKKKIGEISKVMERGVKAVETLLRFIAFSILPTIMEVIFVCIFMLIYYAWYYSVSLLAVLIVYFLWTSSVTQWRTAYIRKMKIADNESGNRAVDSLINYESVKYFNNQKYEVNKYSELLVNYSNLAIKNRLYLSILNVGQGIIIAAGLVVLNLLVVRDIMHGGATIGDFALINAYLLQLYTPLNNLGFSYREVKLACVDIQLIRELLSYKDVETDQSLTEEFVFKDGKIEFRDVEFGYLPEIKVLKGVSFSVGHGKTLAIVGKSGSGKSTISKLLFGLYAPSSGAVLIDDQDISTLSKESFQKYIGCVPQDVALFNDTIFNNIAYADPFGATMDEVVKVAKLASIHDFIMKTPDQYQTIVGERGLKLSGGEKQRVAIARMLLKKSKVLIFDEASSSLDAKTEFSIKESIRSIGGSYTNIIIAHRLSTVVYADEILVLAKGKIVERGTHTELIEKSGLYAEMWGAQSQCDG